MKPYDKNPRRITAVQREQLQEWLAELGDLSGIVHDLNRDQIIGGNQRSDVFDINACEIEIVQEFDRPDDQGTVALGYVIWNDHRYSYRQVRWTAEQCEKANIVANAAGGDWDIHILLKEFNEQDLKGWGMGDGTLDRLLADIADDLTKDKKAMTVDEAKKSLADRFIIPPFSVFDARQGYWQDRKARWLALGIQSELGRGDTDGVFESEPMERKNAYAGRKKGKKATGRVYGQDIMKGEWDPEAGTVAAAPKGTLYHSLSGRVPDYYIQKRRVEEQLGRALDNKEFEEKYLVIGDGSTVEASGTSIFDPVLCELAYSWFSAPEASILDPFAGGSVRGIVANFLGRHYTGIDLSAKQIESNCAQATAILPDNPPTWLAGDSLELTTLLPNDQLFDYIFSSPPYADLEVYSDDPRDISNMTYVKFLEIYREIVRLAVDRLRPDRFATFVVGEARGKDGNYYNLVSDTIAAFLATGYAFYNEAVLITTAGSLPIRVARQFEKSRKLGKTHQNVLTFIKGSATAATAWCGAIDVPDPAEMFGEIS